MSKVQNNLSPAQQGEWLWADLFILHFWAPFFDLVSHSVPLNSPFGAPMVRDKESLAFVDWSLGVDPKAQHFCVSSGVP